jgi:hypothetical protein
MEWTEKAVLLMIGFIAGAITAVDTILKILDYLGG